MSTLETRTGYGDRHHEACDCKNCVTDRSIAALANRVWTAADPEDLDTSAPASVVTLCRRTVPNWHPELRVELEAG